jgi:hypothetical protein
LLRESREEIERFVASAEEASLVVTLRVSD